MEVWSVTVRGGYNSIQFYKVMGRILLTLNSHKFFNSKSITSRVPSTFCL